MRNALLIHTSAKVLPKGTSINSYQLATHHCKMQLVKNFQASMKKMFNYMLLDLLRDVPY